MKNLAYYIATGVEIGAINAGSLASDAAPVIVNCAGCLDTKFDFTTHNKEGRLDFYLMHITKGKLSVRFDKKIMTAEAGDTVIFPPKYPYKYRYDGNGDGLSYLWVHFTGSAAAFYLSAFGFDELPVIHGFADTEKICAGFCEMFDIFSARGEYYETALAAPLLKILSALPKREKTVNRISRSLAYINASYTDEIRIPTLAAMENISNSRYYTVFTETMGVAPKRYIIELRIRHACELLASTDLSVKQIGGMVGYPEPHFFCKIFSECTGSSPSQYRKEHK